MVEAGYVDNNSFHNTYHGTLQGSLSKVIYCNNPLMVINHLVKKLTFIHKGKVDIKYFKMN